MAVTALEKKRLKALAHHLHPVAQVGAQGMSDAFVQSVREALHARELVKVKVSSSSKKESSQELAKVLDAELINLIGFNAILYKYNKELDEHVLDDKEEM